MYQRRDCERWPECGDSCPQDCEHYVCALSQQCESCAHFDVCLHWLKVVAPEWRALAIRQCNPFRCGYYREVQP